MRFVQKVLGNFLSIGKSVRVNLLVTSKRAEEWQVFEHGSWPLEGASLRESEKGKEAR